MSFYPVYREISDNASQSFNDFTLNLARFEGYYNFKNERFYLKSFDLMNIKSLMPSDYLLSSQSFNILIGVRQSDDLKNNRVSFIGEFGIGKTYEVVKDNFKLYFMPSLGYFETVYIKPEIGAIVSFTAFDKTIIIYERPLKYDYYRDYRLLINQNLYLNDRVSFKIDYEINREYKNFRGGIKMYF
jgi:hypothetical protein